MRTIRYGSYTDLVKGDDTGHTSRNAVQIGFSVNPQSRFVFSGSQWPLVLSSSGMQVPTSVH